MTSINEKCEGCGEKFLIISQEQNFYKERDIPFPKNCPTCRQRRRLSLRSERKLYGTTCDECGTEIIVAFNPPKDQKVLCKDCYTKFYEDFDGIIE